MLVAREGESAGVCVLGEGSASGCGPCACLYRQTQIYLRLKNCGGSANDVMTLWRG